MVRAEPKVQDKPKEQDEPKAQEAVPHRQPLEPLHSGWILVPVGTAAVAGLVFWCYKALHSPTAAPQCPTPQGPTLPPTALQLKAQADPFYMEKHVWEQHRARR